MSQVDEVGKVRAYYYVVGAYFDAADSTAHGYADAVVQYSRVDATLTMFESASFAAERVTRAMAALRVTLDAIQDLLGAESAALASNLAQTAREAVDDAARIGSNVVGDVVDALVPRVGVGAAGFLVGGFLAYKLFKVR